MDFISNYIYWQELLTTSTGLPGLALVVAFLIRQRTTD